MPNTQDWGHNRAMWVRVLEKRTGHGVAEWVRRIEQAHLTDEQSLRAWLEARGVTGYARTLLVMEQFGYPDFLLASAEELLDRQYADRPGLRPIYDAIVREATRLGDVSIQTRKTFVSLVGPRRTFARVQATTKARVDLGLRLEGQEPAGRLRPSRIHETMRVQFELTAPGEVDTEVVRWLRRAYAENEGPKAP
jgi:hypothetical protein